MSKINPEAKIKIVEALRSGNYKQGEGQLRNSNNCYCVWGVICDVSGQAQWAEKPDRHGDFAYGRYTCGPTDEVMEWVTGLPAEFSSVSVTINGVTTNIMNHNDSGATFEQLADAIEEQL